MSKGSALNLIEAMNTNGQKIGAVLGLFAMGFLFLAIYLFGKTAEFSLFAFSIYYITGGLFIFTGLSVREKNIWFIRLFAFINFLLELMALAGWIWVLYLAQENPSGQYDALSNMHYLTLIVFFFLCTLPGFVGIMISIFGMRKPRRKKQ